MLPNQSDPRWQALVQHPERYSYNLLALRILMQRVARHGLDDPQATIDEVYSFFQANERLVQDDIAAIFG